MCEGIEAGDVVGLGGSNSLMWLKLRGHKGMGRNWFIKSPVCQGKKFGFVLFSPGCTLSITWGAFKISMSGSHLLMAVFNGKRLEHVYVLYGERSSIHMEGLAFG